VTTERNDLRDWLVVVACLVCQIGMGVGGYLFPVFLKPVSDDLGWSRTVYAVANPIMSTCVALVGPLVGWLSERRGPRAVLGVGSLLMSGTLFAASRMESVWHFYVVAVGIGVAIACLGDLPTATAITTRFTRRRGLALGVVYIGSNVGGALGVAVGGWLLATGSWRTALSGIGSTLWMLLLPFALLVTLPRRASAHGTAGDGAMAAADDGDAEHAVLTGDEPTSALRQRDFWLLAWVLLAFYLYRLGVNTHLVAFLSDLGYQRGEAALGIGLTIAAGILGKLGAGTIADRIGPRPAAIGNFIAIALASALLLVPEVPLAIPLFLLLHGVATAAEDVVVPLIVGRRFGALHLARIYGLLLLALVPGGILGPLMAGWFFDATGSYAVVFTAFFVCNVSAVLALAAVRARD
jgi:MFS family permease